MTARLLDADDQFKQAAAALHRPLMGTEAVAPLLYALVRMTRPERVLEIGAGQSTLFLLRALADTREDVEAERAALAGKERLRDPAWDELSGLRSRGAVLDWLAAPPALADPDYYEAGYEPCCTSVDLQITDASGAGEVASQVEALGLASLLACMQADFRDAAAHFAERGDCFDFVWFDCGRADDYRDFLTLYWPLVAPERGLVALHFTESVPAHEAAVDDFCAARRSAGDRFEVLTLSEPHKMMQNSVTIIRRVGPPPRYPLTTYVTLS